MGRKQKFKPKHSDCVYHGKLATGLTGRPRIGLCQTHRPVASRSRGNKAILAAQEMFGSAFRQNFDEISPGT